MVQEAKFSSLEGKILVASPHIWDRSFTQSLIYVCAHDESGALGVIINHQIGAINAADLRRYIGEVGQLFLTKDLEQKAKKLKGELKATNKNYPVLLGGPVHSDRVVVLGLTKEQERKFDDEQGVTLYTDLGLFLRDYLEGKNHSKLLFSKGIAAWESSQLEDEIRDNSWFVIPASLEMLFSQRMKSKWSVAIKNLGIERYHNLADYSGHA